MIPCPDDLLAIDTETGGTDAAIHPLLSIAAIAADGDAFHGLILPADGMIIEPEAARINGYTRAGWLDRGALPLASVMINCLAWLRTRRGAAGGRSVPLAHNASFDRAFIQAAERQSGIKISHQLDYHWQCSMTLLSAFVRAGLVPPGNCKLDRLCELAGLDRPAVHDALADARACRDGYAWLLTLLPQQGCKVLANMASDLRDTQAALAQLLTHSLPLYQDIEAKLTAHISDRPLYAETVRLAAAALGTTPERLLDPTGLVPA